MRGFWDLLALLAGPVQPLDGCGSRLVYCSICRAEAVVPVEWADGGQEWRIALRCGNCGAGRTVVLDDDEAGELDRALDRGLLEIARTVAALERRRMLADLESLSVALERDLIDADDFAPPSSAS